LVEAARRRASDAAPTTASVEMKWINGWSAAATFEGEFSDVTRSYAGKGAVRYILVNPSGAEPESHRYRL
jgi:hypothetical protein